MLNVANSSPNSSPNSTRSSPPGRWIFATRALAEWAETFAAEPDRFWSPVNSLEDVVADDQFHAAGGAVYVSDGDGSIPMVATPADFDGTPCEPRSVALRLGEHTDEGAGRSGLGAAVVNGSGEPRGVP